LERGKIILEEGLTPLLNTPDKSGDLRISPSVNKSSLFGEGINDRPHLTSLLTFVLLPTFPPYRSDTSINFLFIPLYLHLMKEKD